MSGFSGLPSLFSGPSTVGGSQGTIGTTPGVRNDAGQLVEFDPSRMAGTYSSPTSAPPGMPNLGMPSDAMKFLTTGQPEYSNPAGTNQDPLITQGVQEQRPVSTKIGTGAMTGSGGYGGPLPAAPAATKTPVAAPAAAATQYTMIPYNAPGGYNSPGVAGNQPQQVSDQWNSQTGSSQAVAWNKGSPAAPQVMGGAIYTDNKGGYFSKDPSGKIVPITDATALAAAKGVGKSFGYA